MHQTLKTGRLQDYFTGFVAILRGFVFCYLLKHSVCVNRKRQDRDYRTPTPTIRNISVVSTTASYFGFPGFYSRSAVGYHHVFRDITQFLQANNEIIP
jgi:hypothetical protein